MGLGARDALRRLGFEFYLYSRAVLRRVGSVIEGGAAESSQLFLETYVLGTWLLLVAAAFTFSAIFSTIFNARRRS